VSTAARDNAVTAAAAASAAAPIAALSTQYF